VIRYLITKQEEIGKIKTLREFAKEEIQGKTKKEEEKVKEEEVKAKVVPRKARKKPKEVDLDKKLEELLGKDVV